MKKIITTDSNKKINVLFIKLVDQDNSFNAEIERLVDTADFGIYDTISFKRRDEVNSKTFFNSGRLSLIIEKITPEVDLVLFSEELTGVQHTNLKSLFKVKVIDYIELILYIFKKNAHSKEAKLQVEIAELLYLKNQLIDSTMNYDQIRGGTYSKGKGESQLELNRRTIKKLIAKKKHELELVKKQRGQNRLLRLNSSYPIIAFTGYTNAGKSTLLNRMLEFAHISASKNVYEDDKLFATLDPTTRLITTHRYPTFLAIDTIGFIKKLPTFLIESFKSTLEELNNADLIVHVVDYSSFHYLDEIKTTDEILASLNLEHIPKVYLLNKCDKNFIREPKLPKENEFYTSLIQPDSIIETLDFIVNNLTKSWQKAKILFPFDKNFHQFKRDNYLLSYYQNDDGYVCDCRLNPKTISKYNYLIK